MSVVPNSPVTASIKNRDNAEKDSDIVKDVYVSEEFNMCSDPSERNIRRNKGNVDNKLDDVWKSCNDLEIDG